MCNIVHCVEDANQHAQSISVEGSVGLHEDSVVVLGVQDDRNTKIVIGHQEGSEGVASCH